MNPPDTTGLTKDAGWQIGVQRSVPAPLEQVWEHLIGPDGIATWLGPGADLSPEKGHVYRTENGIEGEVRGYQRLAKVRLTWQPDDRPKPAVLQIALIRKATGTAIRIHQERLTDAGERSRMRAHWNRVLDDLAEALA